jgi:hypothetical protein
MLIGVSFAAASRRLGRAARPVAAGALATIMLAGALSINEYYRSTWQNGGAINWTDAIYQLYAYVRTAPASWVLCMDWGIVDQLRLLGHGKLPLAIIFDAVPPDGGPPDANRLAVAAGDPDHIFIGHTRTFEFFQGRAESFLKAAEAAGYRKDMIGVISDSWGRPTYEVYRFVR